MCAHTPNILVQLSYNTLYHASAPILDPIPRALLGRLITAPVAGCGRACHSAQNRVAQAERHTNATWHFCVCNRQVMIHLNSVPLT